jgi:hypothetical protein
MYICIHVYAHMYVNYLYNHKYEYASVIYRPHPILLQPIDIHIYDYISNLRAYMPTCIHIYVCIYTYICISALSINLTPSPTTTYNDDDDDNFI